MISKKDLHKRSASPLFLQMVSALRRRIESGIWAAGSQIPSLEELASEFGVARATARQAITALETEGMIWRKQGKGTFVSEDFKDKRWLNVSTDLNEVLHWRKGDVKIKHLDAADAVRIPFELPEEFRPAESYRYMKIRQILKSIPYVVRHVYLESKIFGKDPDAYKKDWAFYEFLVNQRVKIESVHQVMTIGAADIENANLLEISIDAPIINVRRYAVNKVATVLYFADNFYPAELVKIEMNMRK
jgi:GntR family transcriptional regulator